MADADVVRMVNEVFEQSFEIEPAKLRPEAHIFKDLGLDSLDTVDLVVALQKKFGVRIQDGTEVRAIETLSSLYDFIAAERAKLPRS
jgi:acyl carrier protein